MNAVKEITVFISDKYPGFILTNSFIKHIIIINTIPTCNNNLDAKR